MDWTYCGLIQYRYSKHILLLLMQSYYPCLFGYTFETSFRRPHVELYRTTCIILICISRFTYILIVTVFTLQTITFL